MTMMDKKCYKYLMDIADERDVYMGCSDYFFIPDDDLKGRAVHFVNTDQYASTCSDFYVCVIVSVEEAGGLK